MRKRVGGFLAAILVPVLTLTALAAAPAAAGLTATAGALQATVADHTGAPLAGARLELHVAGEGLVAAATSDAAGGATLTPPPGIATGGAAWLRVWADGHATVEQPWVPAADGYSVSLTLPAARGSIRGLVSDQMGLPVAGARVSAWLPGLGKAGTVQTGPQGTYVLRNLRPGEYIVQVESNGHRPGAAQATVIAGRAAALDVTLTPASAHVAGAVIDALSGEPVAAARVELVRRGWGVVTATVTGADGRFTASAPPAEDADYTLRLTAPDHAVAESPAFALPAGERVEFGGDRRLQLAPLYGAIWGLVLKADETPVKGARVELQLQAAGTVAAAATDEGGFFAFDRVRPGTYRVRVFPGTDWAPSDSTWLTVAAGEQRAVRILPVNYEEQDFGTGVLAGFVSDGGTRPIAGAAVTLIRGDEVAATTTTDARGRYRFTEVAGNIGTAFGMPVTVTGYVVRVTADGYLPTDQPTNLPDGHLSVHRNELTEAHFDLRPTRAHFAGRVVDDRGQPVPGAAVALYREGDPEPIARTTAGPQGLYAFDALESPVGARYFVTAGAAGYLDAPPSAPLDPGALPGGNAAVDLALHPATARLQGSVTDARGDGVAGVPVTVLRPADGRTWQAVTGSDGWFQVEQLPAGPGDVYLVRAVPAAETGAAGATGAADATARAPAQPAGLRAVTVRLDLAPTAALAGTVTGPDGLPLPGADVELRREGAAAPIARTTADDQGRYQFTDLTPGDRYGVAATAPGYRPSALAPGELALTPLVTAAAGQTARMDIGLTPAWEVQP